MCHSSYKPMGSMFLSEWRWGRTELNGDGEGLDEEVSIWERENTGGNEGGETYWCVK